MSDDSSRTPFLVLLYQQYLDKQDSANFISQVSRRYTTGTLQRLAEHHDREVRRGAILALGFVGDYEVNHTVGRALHDEDRTVRLLAENGIRSVWTRAGSPAERRLLSNVIRLNSAGQYVEAINRAAELIDKAGWFAEAWHQRAVAHFQTRHFVEAIRDCHQTLEINPYHFSAAVSMGQAYVQLSNHVSALECFRRALRLNPNLEGVRVQIERLSKKIDKDS
ncbi:MAG: tetratricopeptide repeat protein [Pirellulales bacterium]|nr:tetratricopeptide repeat protein [Pirellulales bacterium]